MYDFEGTRSADGERTPGARLPRPPLALAALELPRLGVEYPSSILLDLLLPAPSWGAGRPVLVLPGFSATDGLTARLRAHLRRRGWRPHGWGLSRNHGLTDAVVDGLPARLQQLHRRYDEPLDVVGWSFGGLLARWLAHEHPDLVRRLVCLGSPWRPEGEVTRTTVMFERAAQRHGISAHARDIVDTLRRPLPVPCTAVFSKTDGIVNWRGCALDDGPGCENIAVPSSHSGLVSNPLSLAVVVDRLAQDPRDPEPFDWARCLTRPLHRRPPSPVGAGA